MAENLPGGVDFLLLRGFCCIWKGTKVYWVYLKRRGGDGA